MTRRTFVTAPLSAPNYDRFGALIRAVSGLEIPATRRSALDQAVAAALNETGAADTDALYELLQAGRGAAALERLIEALTIGETHFFRNKPQFEALAGRLLPDLIERRRKVQRLRVWSAGCATGEEAYSLAILLEELLPDLNLWDVQILATDINRQSLARAQAGVYSPWSFREVPAGIQAKYFTAQGRNFEVLPRIRERVSFAYLNLVEDSYPSLLNHIHDLDLILFRNVLIYFGQAASQHIAARLHAALADDGWLVVGHADNMPGTFSAFAAHFFDGTVAYQKQSPAAGPAQTAARPAALNTPQAALPAFRPLPDALRARPTAAAPETAALTNAQAQAWAAQGQIEQALAATATLAAVNPSDAQPHYLAAKIEADRQNLAAAEAHIDRALERAPLWAPAHYLRGMILQAAGQAEAAAEALRRCVYADPQFVLGHFALGSLLAQQGQAARAHKALDNVTRLLAGREPAELVAEGDGLTVGRLLDLAAWQKETHDQRQR